VGRLTTLSVVEAIFLVIVTTLGSRFSFPPYNLSMPDYLGEPIIRVRGLVTRFGADTITTVSISNVFRGEFSLSSVRPIGKIGFAAAPSSGSTRRSRAASKSRNEYHERDIDRREIEQRWGVLFQNGRSSAPDGGQNIEVPLKNTTPCRRV